MKKLSLSVQLTLVFSIAFIITSLLLGILITNQLDSIYENSIFEQLEADARTLKATQDSALYEQHTNAAFIRYSSAQKTYNTSNNISDFLDKESIALLINKAAAQETASARYINTINHREMYYIVLNYHHFLNVSDTDVFIVLTDHSMKTNMVRNTALQIFFRCLTAFVFGYFVVVLWITRLVHDTKRVTKVLSRIGDNHYKTKITTKRQDEIGELVDHIEIMRKKIIQNEKHKQEIIQGVSHDLKTPIAVIQSYAEALEDKLCDPKEVAAITQKQCARLNDKVTKLLTLTRLGYIQIDHQTIETTKMDELIRELILSYNYQTNVNIKLNLTEIEFIGDEDSWFIAIQNILDNAIRYANSKIIIDLTENNLVIFNDGKHINKNKLPTIFNAYEKGTDGNFGIGLSIVKQTSELFNYTVSAKNLDEGVCFTITKKANP